LDVVREFFHPINDATMPENKPLHPHN
jgi:hypothetical protein